MSNAKLNQQLEGQLDAPRPGLDQEGEFRTQLLNRLIVGQTVAVSLLTVMTMTGELVKPGSGLLALIPLGAIAAAIGLISYWLVRQHQVRLASYFFLIGTAVAITSNVYVRGYQDTSAIYYLWPILAAVTLLETRGSILIATISAIFYLTLVALQRLGYQSPPLPYDPQGEALLTVGSRLLMFFLLVFLGWLASQNLIRALQQASQAAQRLTRLNETLEQRVAERTKALERRTRSLEATTAVAQEAASMLDVQELLNRVATLVSEHFDFYHTGLFLIDSTGQWAELQAASSEGGRRMLTRQHRLRVGAQGIVGYVTGQGQARIALDVGADVVHFDNPDLPNTRSEMALPLRARKEIIGALDVQSTEPQAFSTEDLAVLQALADQVALAISNARLIQQTQESLEAQRRAFGEFSREAWDEIRRTQSELGFLSDESGIAPASDQWEPQMKTALRTGESTLGGGDGTAASTLAIPVKVRGRVIGVVDAQKPGAAGEWTAEEARLMETLCDQLGAALEDARLFRETQYLADRERTTREIVEKIRQATDMETLMQTTVREVAAVLGVPSVFVQFSTPPPLTGEEDGNGTEPPV